MVEGDSSARGENTAGLLLWKKRNVLRLNLKESRVGFLLERNRKVIPCTVS